MEVQPGQLHAERGDGTDWVDPIVFFVFGIQSGSLVDYVSNAAVDGCSSGPAVGWPGAVLFAVIGLPAIGYFVYHALRRI